VRVLSDYAARRERDQAQTIAASDGLPRLFMPRRPGARHWAATWPWRGWICCPRLRRQFVQQAAGMAALEAAHG
jgi:2-octaprenyl-6-methoxyphenol hydroxylase